jgi:gluconolactonase
MNLDTILPVALCTLALGPRLPAQVTLVDPAGSELVAFDAVIEKLASGMKFVEGPVWLANDAALVFSDIPRGLLLRWSAKDGVTEWRVSAQSNGNTLDRDGQLITCQHEARNIVRHEADGSVTVLATKHDGKLLNSPNDAAVRSDGTVWFTDPTYGLAKRDKEQAGNFVYRLDPATGELAVVQRDFDQPNGLCFSPDHDRLYIADSGRGQRVGAFPVSSDRTLGEPLFWLEGGSDGMRCDMRGNLYTTSRDGVRIYSPKGERLATIALPEVPANCAFGGADFRTLFVTARTSLYRVELKVRGASIPPPPAAAPTPESAVPPDAGKVAGPDGKERLAPMVFVPHSGWR